MSEVVIVSAVRTAIGKFQGSLQSYTSPRTGRTGRARSGAARRR